MTRLGQQPLVHKTARVETTMLGAYTEIAQRCRIEECKIGDYSYLMEDCSAWCTQIGKFASIASNVRFNATNHPMERAAQHHFSYRSHDYWNDAEADAEFFARRRNNSVQVGHDVWIGHAAIILPGVSIGDGAVVGAGAVVTRDVEPYVIVCGNPARPIRRRFSPTIARDFQCLAWWDWPHHLLRERLADFRLLDADRFIKKYGDGSHEA